MSTDGCPQFGRVPAGWLYELHRLDQSTARVALAICIHVNARSWSARPSVATLAEATGLTERSVRRAHERLVAQGFLTVEGKGGRNRTNTYRLNPDTNGVRLFDEKPGHDGVPVSAQNPDAGAPKPGRTKAKTRTPRVSGEQRNRGDRGGRKRDPIWDAVVHHFGLKPVTTSEKSRVGRVVRELRAKGAEPDDVGWRIERYRAAWPNITCTPEALLKHWDAFAEPAGELNADPIEPPDEVFMDE